MRKTIRRAIGSAVWRLSGEQSPSMTGTGLRISTSNCVASWFARANGVGP